MENIKLFCLPYAGGSAKVYNKWKTYLAESIELCPVELPGRGRRFGERLHSTLDEAVNDVYALIGSELKGAYAFFGHSMGTLIIYELLKIISQQRLVDPKHVFLSGRYPPHINRGRQLHALPDDEFIAEVLSLGGTPEELLESKELMDIFIPILRADYRIVENYVYADTSTKWDFDISVLAGKDDAIVSLDDAGQWSRYSNCDCKIYEFEGGHFFINDNLKKVTSIINDTLLKVMCIHGWQV